MTWIKVEDQSPPTGEELLVIKTFLDAEYGERGYHPDKSFWTRPTVQIDTLWSDKRWDRGGKVTHWMKLPEIPSENRDC